MPPLELYIDLFPGVTYLISDLNERIVTANCCDNKNNNESEKNKEKEDHGPLL
jgi:hypothetical protein